MFLNEGVLMVRIGNWDFEAQIPPLDELVKTEARLDRSFPRDNMKHDLRNKNAE
jgi:hypothetical protein